MPKMKRPNGTIASVVEKGVPHLLEQGYTLLNDGPASETATVDPASTAPAPSAPASENPPAPSAPATVDPPSPTGTTTFDIDGTDDVDALRAHAVSIGLEIPGNVSRADTIRERIKEHQAGS